MPTNQPIRDDGEGRASGPPATLRALRAGEVLGGRYRIERLLGRGGMGEVWQAYDLKLRVDCALKSLRSERFQEDKYRELLRREVRAARDVVSPNVCRIFDLEEIHGQELVSMEYVDGSTLMDILANRGPLELREASEIASQLLAGLQAIHEAGFVHRDIKPENVMITRSGRVVVMDFGIAKMLPRSDGATEVGGGTIAGTPAYMAPEQMRGEDVDARADVFSAGVVLAEMISSTGVRDQTTRESVWKAVRSDPPRLDDGPWAPLIRQAVAVDPDVRFPSARALTRALEEIALRAEGEEEISPYPGLAAFTQAEAEHFFGRESEVEAAWLKLQRFSLMALIGPSGAGKSSFLRAGLMAAAPHDWRCRICTPGTSPFIALSQGLVQDFAGDPEAIRELMRLDDLDRAVPMLRRWREQTHEALLVVDQFEELFTLNPSEVQERFVELLGRLTLEADIHVLISMRDDFFFVCHRFRTLAPLFSASMPLAPLAGSDLRRALVQPALTCGYRFEDDSLVDEMLTEVADERGALPLLAFAAARLWEKRDRGDGVITRAAYREIEGVGGALAQHAEATLERIGSEHVPLVRQLMRELVTAQGTRAVREVDDLLSVFDDPDAARDVLAALVDARLLTTFESHDGEQATTHRQVEIIHESLLSAWPRLVRWQTQDADGAQLRDQLRQAAQLWEERDRSEDLLWSGTAFREFELWRERYAGKLGAREDAFASAMVDRDRRRRRRRRLATLASFAVLCLVLAVVGVAWQRAETQRRRATAQHLLSLGQRNLERDPSWALAFAIASLEMRDDSEVRRFAIEALWKGPTKLLVGGLHGWGLEFSPDGRYLAVGANERILLLAEDGSEVAEMEVPGGYVQYASFHPERPWLMGTDRLSKRPVARIWSVPDGALVDSLDLEVEGSEAWWADNGTSLVTATPLRPNPAERLMGTLRWRSWSLPDLRPRELGQGGDISSFPPQEPDLQRRRYVDLSEDGTRIYVRSLDDFDDAPGRLVARSEAGFDAKRLGPAAFFPDGRRIVTESHGLIQVWSIEDGARRPLRTLGTYTGILHFGFDATERFLAGASSGSNIFVWDLMAPPAADALVLREGGQTNGVVFHPEGRWVATASRTALWPLTRRYPLVLRGLVDGAIIRVAFHPEGEWLATSNLSDGLRLWSLAADSPAPAVPGEPLREIWDISLDAAGETVLMSSYHGNLQLHDLRSGESRALDGMATSDIAYGIALSPDASRAAASPGHVDQGAEFGILHVWELPSGEHRTLDAGHHGQVLDMEFTSTGRLVTAGHGGLWLWDLDTDEPRQLRDDLVIDVDVSADGQRILSCGERVVVHDLGTGETRELTAHAGQGYGAIDPSGEWVATGRGGTGEIRWGPVTGEEPHLLLSHAPGIGGLDIDPQGRWIVSGGDDGTIRLWPVPEGRPFHTLPRTEFLARLRALTNMRVVPNPEARDGYGMRIDPFPGWAEAPSW